MQGNELNGRMKESELNGKKPVLNEEKDAEKEKESSEEKLVKVRNADQLCFWLNAFTSSVLFVWLANEMMNRK